MMRGRSVRLNIESEDDVIAIAGLPNVNGRPRERKEATGKTSRAKWKTHFDTELCYFGRLIKLNMRKKLLGEHLRCDLLNSLIVDDEFSPQNANRLPPDFACAFRDSAVDKFGIDTADDLLLGEAKFDLSEITKISVNLYAKRWRNDPLDESCFHGEMSSHCHDRILGFAKHVREMLTWSLVAEPGRLTCHLSKFIDEFATMDTFFEKTRLYNSEVSCTAFKKHFSGNTRDHRLLCLDRTRVIVDSGEYDASATFSPERSYYGAEEFIHANYVSGGPLFNRFICTQAPLPQTTSTFWKMVFEHRCQFIFMLCSASDSELLNNSNASKECPYYWPRVKGSTMTYGALLISNVNVNYHMDPLFTVTVLKITSVNVEQEQEPLYVQHWQWNWKSYQDTTWPLRLLRLSRTSRAPTVVHCIDGCGRTGTLVAIESVLCQLFRGAVSTDRAVLSSCLFVRLQRKHAISNYKQYLFIYRCVLNWILPHISSQYDQLMLGSTVRGVGFISAYEELIDGFS